MSVTVDVVGSVLRTGVPQPLFDTAIYGGGAAQPFTPRWDLSRDGQQILLNRVATGTPSSSITILQNWQRLLRSSIR